VVRANIKGVFSTYKTLKDGMRRTYWYHRETGGRLHGEPGSPEFIADLAAAEKLIRDRLAGTFNNLVRLFTLSTEFETALATSTKTEYRRMLTKAEAEFGDMPIAALDDPRVRREFMDWREKVARASGEREADNRLSAISAMLTWAIERGHMTANHLRAPRIRRARATALSRPARHHRHLAVGERQHAATDRHHHRPLAQDRASDSGALSRANQRARRAGDLQLGELRANEVCERAHRY
jgi:hypothetical protein